jgi:C-terminal, D2-small domain, of ClpB protein
VQGFDPVYGARPVKRALQRELQTRLAQALLRGEVGEGDAVLGEAATPAIGGGLTLRKMPPGGGAGETVGEAQPRTPQQPVAGITAEGRGGAGAGAPATANGTGGAVPALPVKKRVVRTTRKASSGGGVAAGGVVPQTNGKPAGGGAGGGSGIASRSSSSGALQSVPLRLGEGEVSDVE